MLLQVDNLVTSYGKIEALKGISLEVEQGEIVTLIGANGAGKSTTLKTITGQLKPSDGKIEFNGKSIVGMPAHTVAELGIVQVPEGRRMFARLTVLENLRMGAFIVRDQALVRQRTEQVFALFPRLAQRRDQVAGTLSGGEQQMLAMGRGLMSQPKLLLLDEPSLGLAPLLTRDIFKTICEIRQRGTTILLVEQNARMALSVADDGYVLETGRVVLQDSAKILLTNEQVKKAYLGG